MNAAATYRWDGLNATTVAAQFDLQYVELLQEVDSTQDLAHERAAAGLPKEALIVADAQRSGRGRLGRSWTSEPRAGVWCTMVAHPQPSALDTLSLRVGLGIAERLDPLAAEMVRVKWPNDLMLRGGKLGGILVEARWSGTTLAWVAVGVGINVAAPAIEGAAGLAPDARRIDVLAAVVEAVRAACSLGGSLSEPELLRYRRRDILMGRALRSPAAGTAAGISADGALLVRTARGVESFRTGTVQLAEDA